LRESYVPTNFNFPLHFLPKATKPHTTRTAHAARDELTGGMCSVLFALYCFCYAVNYMPKFL